MAEQDKARRLELPGSGYFSMVVVGQNKEEEGSLCPPIADDDDAEMMG